jgi:hypothetical protein
MAQNMQGVSSNSNNCCVSKKILYISSLVCARCMLQYFYLIAYITSEMNSKNNNSIKR